MPRKTWKLRHWTFNCDGEHLVLAEPLAVHESVLSNGNTYAQTMSGSYYAEAHDFQAAVWRLLCKLYRDGSELIKPVSEFYRRKGGYGGVQKQG